MKLTNLTPISESMAYVASALIISFLMQVITFLVMAIYFSVVDKVNIQSTVYWSALGFMLLGAIGATLLNLVIVLFINSSTTFSRLSAVIEQQLDLWLQLTCLMELYQKLRKI